MNPPTTTQRLLIDFAHIGDLVIEVPLLRSLAADAHLDLLTRPFGPHLFEGQSFVREAIALAHPNRGRRRFGSVFLSGHRTRLGRQLMRRGYDEILLMEEERPVIRDWVESWRGKSRVRFVDHPNDHPDRLRRARESLGMVGEGDPVPVLDVGEEDRIAAAGRIGSLGDRVLAVQVGSAPASVAWRRKRNLKGLTADQWTAFLTELLDRGEVDAVVFTGIAIERRYVRPIIAGLPQGHRKRVHDWTGRTKLSELRALLTAFWALVSVDTGTAHLAAAVGCPVLTFFGPADPAAYSPRGRGPVETLTGFAPCQFCMGTPLFKTCRDNVCMQSLELPQMIAAWGRLTGRLAR